MELLPLVTIYEIYFPSSFMNLVNEDMVEELQWNPMGNLFYIKLSNKPLHLWIVDFRTATKESQQLQISNMHSFKLSIQNTKIDQIQWHPWSDTHLGILSNNYFYLYHLQQLETMFHIPNYFQVSKNVSFIQFHFLSDDDYSGSVVFVSAEGIIAMVSYLYPQQCILPSKHVKKEWLHSSHIVQHHSDSKIQISNSNLIDKQLAVTVLPLEESEMIVQSNVLSNNGFVYLTSNNILCIGYLFREEEEEEENMELQFFALEKLYIASLNQTSQCFHFSTLPTSLFITIPKKGVYQLLTTFLYEMQNQPEQLNKSQWIQLYRKSSKEVWIGYDAWNNTQFDQHYLIGFSENWRFLCLQVQIVPVTLMNDLKENTVDIKIPASQMENKISQELQKKPSNATTQSQIIKQSQQYTWKHVDSILNGFNRDLSDHFSVLSELVKQDVKNITEMMEKNSVEELKKELSTYEQNVKRVTSKLDEFYETHKKLKNRLQMISKELDKKTPLSSDEEDLIDRLDYYKDKLIPTMKLRIKNLRDALKEQKTQEQEDHHQLGLTGIQQQIVLRTMQELLPQIKALKQETKQLKQTMV